MNRRLFLCSGVAACIMAPLAALASDTLAYKPGLIKKHLAAGETILVDYWASWCSTCAVQDRVLKKLRAANPAYDKAITFIRVDWDQYSSASVTTSRNIPRRSTLIILKGDKELGRLVAQTSEKKIKVLLDSGLAAGS